MLTQDLQLGLVENWHSLGLRESLLQTQSWEGSTAEALDSLEAKFPPSCIVLEKATFVVDPGLAIPGTGDAMLRRGPYPQDPSPVTPPWLFTGERG